MLEIINNNKKLICDAMLTGESTFQCGESGLPSFIPDFVGDLIPDDAKENMKNGVCNAITQLRSTLDCDTVS